MKKTIKIESRSYRAAILAILFDSAVLTVSYTFFVDSKDPNLFYLYLFVFCISYYLLSSNEYYFNLAVLKDKTAYRGQIISSYLKTIFVFSMFSLSYNYEISLFKMCGVFLSSYLCMMVCHYFIRKFKEILNKKKNTQERVLIAGCTNDGKKLSQLLQTKFSNSYQFVGFLEDRDISRLGEQNQSQIVGRFDEVKTIIEKEKIDVVIIAIPVRSYPRIQHMINQIASTTASISFIPDLLCYDIMQSTFVDMDGIPLVVTRDYPFRGLNGLLKRVLDLTLSAITILLLIPLFIFLALLIKLTSPGPVLFKQKRFGMKGEEYQIYKFRSMYKEASEKFLQATENDARVTKVGRFLRASSLDELPQLFNVFIGNMSLVGPRPHATEQNDFYRDLIKGYMFRYKIKPGITGWAQVNGLRGPTQTIDKMEERVKLDDYYLRNWSFGLDIYILFKTFFIVFKRTNAV